VCGTSLSALLALWATPLTGSRVSFATARGKDELALTVLPAAHAVRPEVHALTVPCVARASPLHWEPPTGSLPASASPRIIETAPDALVVPTSPQSPHRPPGSWPLKKPAIRTQLHRIPHPAGGSDSCGISDNNLMSGNPTSRDYLAGGLPLLGFGYWECSLTG
jgi:hypothetical protein